MSIVSSVILLETPQIDGRIWVVEQFTDNLGIIYQQTYLAPSSSTPTTLAAHLAADATALSAGLAANEVASNLASVLALGSLASPTEHYSTSPENVAALAAAAPTGVQAVMCGDYLNTLTTTALEAAFGWTLQQTQTNQTTYFQPYAAAAATIRAATAAWV
jgi:hypothetical protein